jgi:hypothetical protein
LPHGLYLALVGFIDELQRKVIPDDEYSDRVRKLEQISFLFDRPLEKWVSVR